MNIDVCLKVNNYAYVSNIILPELSVRLSQILSAPLLLSQLKDFVYSTPILTIYNYIYIFHALFKLCLLL